MKKILAVGLIGLASFGALAHGPGHGHHGYYQHHGGGWGWVAPAIISGAVVYAATRPPVVQQPPVIIQQPPYVQQTCTPWTEIRNSDGSVTYTRTCQ